MCCLPDSPASPIMSDFPTEALPSIFSQLRGSDLRTLLALLGVSKLWRETALADGTLWTSILVPPSIAPRLTNERLQAVLIRAQRRGFEVVDLTGCLQLTVESLDNILEECHRFPQRLSFVGCPLLQWTQVLALLEKLQKACPQKTDRLKAKSWDRNEVEENGIRPIPKDASLSQSYIEVPGGLIRNPHFPTGQLLAGSIQEVAPHSGRQAHKLVRPELRLQWLGVAGIDFRRCKWRQLRTLMQYTQRLDVGECEDERCFQIRVVRPCASCLSECCEQHLYRYADQSAASQSSDGSAPLSPIGALNEGSITVAYSTGLNCRRSFAPLFSISVVCPWVPVAPQRRWVHPDRGVCYLQQAVF